MAKIYESGYSDLEFDEEGDVIEPDDPYALIKIETAKKAKERKEKREKLQEKLEALEKQRAEMQAILNKLRSQLKEKSEKAVEDGNLKPMPVLWSASEFE